MRTLRDDSLHIINDWIVKKSIRHIYIYSLNLENLWNFQFLATNDVIYTQPKIYKSQRIILGERNNAETCNSDNSSPIPRLHVEMYPIRYASPMNMMRKQRIDEDKEDDEKEEEEEEEEDENQEDENASRVTRFWQI